jgi:diguanylate cyclase (GGDEF)-like protein
MDEGLSVDLEGLDLEHAVEIAPRIWWVGHELAGDEFQCHVYLIEHGDQSVLIDPGSVLTFKDTLRKIEEVIPFSNIRYFICHHQDPDITGALGLIENLVTRDDARIITHWRAQVLLKHYNLKIPMWLIDANDWSLDLGGRQLKFIFTPYLHFPGAFCTLDEKSGVLFSSDLFGGFGGEFQLIARDESCFGPIKTFHEHYMPGMDILRHALQALEKEPIRMIAPQHGYIIPGPLVRPIMERLKGLECGLYLMARSDTDIQRLMQLNHILKRFMKSMVLYMDFGDMARSLLLLAKEVLPLEDIEFYVQGYQDRGIMHFHARNRYHGEAAEATEFFPRPLEDEDGDKEAASGGAAREYEWLSVERGGEQKMALLLPLSTDRPGACRAAALLLFSRPTEISDELGEILDQMLIPLSVAIERENIRRMLERERNVIYSRSIRDTLTGLYNRQYMDEAVNRLIDSHNRDYTDGLAAIMVDIDDFKEINDAYGHDRGDTVLKAVAGALRGRLRKVDIPVRYGGDEFCFFVLSRTLNDAVIVAERMRDAVNALDFKVGNAAFRVSVSAGVALHRQNESLEDLIKRADLGLYEAKKAGRNRVGRSMT